MEKQYEYSAKLLSAIQSCFDEDSENHISLSELTEESNLTHFMHALSNMVPAMTYTNFTKQKVNILDFNHIANKLAFQYANKEKEVPSE
ncbi:hypothetical protein [Pedobacter antarcticus]|uniref:hypothetical protein n=1 Tax=Pedobacter antarcticus TaxID=34086 RepID=UPI00292CCA33|nr:hypothetical protein [Pedobacter antarcticus]